MRRRHVLLTSLVMVAMGCATGAGAASGADVEVHKSGGIYGELEFLVNSSGYSLYAFSKDKWRRNTRERCQHIKGCAATWHPLIVTEEPTAGPGVNPMLLSTITLANGSKQVTYAKRPLYTNTADPHQFEIYYFGAREFRGSWLGVDPMGGTF